VPPSPAPLPAAASLAMSLSTAGAARKVRKRHMLHGTRAKRSSILSVIVRADRTSAATV
jgi:hypothetical protein